MLKVSSDGRKVAPDMRPVDPPMSEQRPTKISATSNNPNTGASPGTEVSPAQLKSAQGLLLRSYTGCTINLMSPQYQNDIGRLENITR